MPELKSKKNVTPILFFLPSHGTQSSWVLLGTFCIMAKQTVSEHLAAGQAWRKMHWKLLCLFGTRWNKLIFVSSHLSSISQILKTYIIFQMTNVSQYTSDLVPLHRSTKQLRFPISLKHSVDKGGRWMEVKPFDLLQVVTKKPATFHTICHGGGSPWKGQRWDHQTSLEFCAWAQTHFHPSHDILYVRYIWYLTYTHGKVSALLFTVHYSYTKDAYISGATLWRTRNQKGIVDRKHRRG